MGSNWEPLFYGLAIIFVVATIVILVFTSLNLDTSVVNPDSSFGNSPLYVFPTNYLRSNFVDMVDTGVNIFGFEINLPSINPFAIIGDDAITFIINQLTAMTYIPDVIVFPFMILVIIGALWTIIKLILP